jgi:hypothetical protein
MIIIAFVASGFFVFQSEQRIASRHADLRIFATSEQSTAAILSELRAAEQAYVAAGQGVGFWMPKVESLLESGKSSVDHLRETSSDPSSRSSLMEAASAVTEFANADKRAREYIKSDEPLMAADVLFTEAGEAIATALRQIASAGTAEQSAFDAFEARTRQAEMYAVGGSAVFALFLVVVLTVLPRATAANVDVEAPAGADIPLSLSIQAVPAPKAPREAARLKTAADVATEIGRVADVASLTPLLARMSESLDASGLIVWIGSTSGGDLRPALSHGYPPQVLTRLPPIAQSADNAAAAAYRTSAMQVVRSRADGAAGAIVAPLLGAQGCIGALTAEIRGGGETSEATQSIARIFAAQLSLSFAAASPAAATGVAPSAARAV